MRASRSIARKVFLGTFLSTLACLSIYSVILPFAMAFDAGERVAFWIRMGSVGVVAALIATLVVYRFLNPVRSLMDQRAACADADLDCGSALRALDRIPRFLLWFGAFAYFAAAAVNLGLDLMKNGGLDGGIAGARLFLAAAWGFLNGIVTARLLDTILIEAKLALRVFDLSQVNGREGWSQSSLRGKLAASGLALFIFLVVFSSVVFYMRVRASLDGALDQVAALLDSNADPGRVLSALEEIKAAAFAAWLPSGFAVLGSLLLIASALYFVILANFQAHFDDLLGQVGRMAQGDKDLSRRAAVVSSDEIGRMTSAFNRILDSLTRTFGRVRSLAGRVYEASGAVTKSSEIARREAANLARLALETEKAERERVVELGRAMSAFKAAAGSVEGSAERSAEEAREIERAALGLKSMTESFARSGDEAARVEEAFQSLSETARRGEEGVAKSLSVAAEIAESGSRVGKIAVMIAEVAERSNLLAMNASIEAAHAGEAGKGFGVVAREMKTLAESVAKSAKAIGEEVHGVEEKNSRAVHAIQGLGAVFSELAAEIGATADAVSRIARAARKNAEEAREDLALIERLAGLTAEIEAAASAAKTSGASMEEAVARLSASQTRSGEVNAALAEGVRSIATSFEELEASLNSAINGVQELEGEVSSYRLA